MNDVFNWNLLIGGSRMRGLLCVLCLLVTSPLSAAPIEYTFSGTITNVFKAATFRDEWLPGVEQDGHFTGTVTIDHDPLLSVPTGALYTQRNLEGDDWVIHLSSLMTIAVGGNLVMGADNDLPDGDRFSLHNLGDLWQPTSGFRGELIQMLLLDPTSTRLDQGLPTTLDGFTRGTFLLTGRGVAVGELPRASVSGRIDSLTRVPEPATLLLLTFGVVGAFGSRRRLRAS